MGLVLLEPPGSPIVSLEEVQLHLRADSPQEGPLVQALVAAATAQAEAYCRRRFLTQRWRATWNDFPAGALLVPHPPLRSVDTLTYRDGGGSLQTLDPAAYLVRPAEAPGEVVPAYGTRWPTTRREPDAVAVEFTCGYGDPADVPEAIRRAVLLLVGTLYANRETVAPVAMQAIPHTAEWLLGPYRVVRFAA